MDTISYEQKNKGALYEHPCLLYEAKKWKDENEDGNESLLSTLSPCGYSPCLRERVGWRDEDGKLFVRFRTPDVRWRTVL